jgi:hypothetical protein
MKDVTLNCGKLKVEFLFGNCILVYKNTILTKKLGLYSSIYYQHKWYDSTYAQWEIIENKKDKKVLYGKWVNIPHRQKWILKTPCSDTLHWFVECENIDTLNIDMIQQNYMLTDLYTFWKVKEYGEGIFPEYFANYKGLLWDRLWSMPEKEGVKISLTGDKNKVNIPEIVWGSLTSRDDTIVAIENSDPRYSARVLQLLFVGGHTQKSVGECIVLKSELKINDEVS